MFVPAFYSPPTSIAPSLHPTMFIVQPVSGVQSPVEMLSNRQCRTYMNAVASKPPPRFPCPPLTLLSPALQFAVASIVWTWSKFSIVCRPRAAHEASDAVQISSLLGPRHVTMRPRDRPSVRPASDRTARIANTDAPFQAGIMSAHVRACVRARVDDV